MPLIIETSVKNLLVRICSATVLLIFLFFPCWDSRTDLRSINGVKPAIPLTIAANIRYTESWNTALFVRLHLIGTTDVSRSQYFILEDKVISVRFKPPSANSGYVHFHPDDTSEIHFGQRKDKMGSYNAELAAAVASRAVWSYSVVIEEFMFGSRYVRTFIFRHFTVPHIFRICFSPSVLWRITTTAPFGSNPRAMRVGPWMPASSHHTVPIYLDWV